METVAPAKLSCPACGRSLDIPAHLAGQRARCPNCKTPLEVAADLSQLTVVQTAADTAVPPVRQTDSGGAFPATDGTPPQLPAGDSMFPAIHTGGAAGFPAVQTRNASFAATMPRRSGNPTVLIVAAAGVVGLVVLGAIVAAAVMALGGSSINRALIYMPDDAQFLVTVDVDEIIGSESWSMVKKAFPGVAQAEKRAQAETGMNVSDIDRVTIGGSADKKTGVLVVETNAPIDLEKVLKQSGKFVKQDVAGLDVHVRSGAGSNPEGFCLVDDRTLLFGPASTLKKVLERGGEPKFSAGFQQALDSASMSKSVVVVANLKDIDANNARALTRGNPFAAGLPSPDDVESAVIELDISSRLDLQTRFTFAKAADAADADKKLNEGLAEARKQKGIPDKFKKVLDSVEVSSSGKELTASASVDTAEIIEAVKGFPFFPF